MKKFLALVLGIIVVAWLISCGSSSSNNSTASRTLTALTNATGTNVSYSYPSTPSNQVGVSACDTDVTSGGTNCTYTTGTCAQITESTSSCQSARTALGLSGNWLDFSCNVVIGCANSSLTSMSTCSGATYVTLTTEGIPDYPSNYYPTTGSYSFTANGYTVTGTFDALYSAFSTPFPDPGSIGAPTATETMYIPMNPAQCTSGSCNSGSGSPNAMPMGAVGMAINGVMIFSSMANGTDNIFAEAGSFDKCGGHPAGTQYHHHNEPVALSSNDDNLIGVMMDGFWVYGRKDSDGTTPGSLANEEAAAGGSTSTNTIYYFGGHVGTLPNNSGINQFHYHATEWIGCVDETTATNAGYRYSDDAMAYDTFNSSNFSGSPAAGTDCSGVWVDAWFLTGHGNGGVLETPTGVANGGIGSEASPVWVATTGTYNSGTNAASGGKPSTTTCGGAAVAGGCVSQNTAGIRYYYGTPGSCSNCN